MKQNKTGSEKEIENSLESESDYFIDEKNSIKKDMTSEADTLEYIKKFK